MNTNLRRATPADVPFLQTIFRTAVLEGTANHYDDAQRSAWAASADDPTLFTHRLATQTFLVATATNDMPLAFGSLESAPVAACSRCVAGEPTAHVDLLYVAPHHHRHGLGRALLAALVDIARSHGARRVTAHVSLAARPLFERMDFVVRATRWPEVRGIAMPNLLMERRLDPHNR